MQNNNSTPTITTSRNRKYRRPMDDFVFADELQRREEEAELLLRQRKRRQHQKRNKRHNDYFDYSEDNDDDKDSRKHAEELLPKWKLFIVGGAIVICFSLLYPSVFAPLIVSFFGSKRVDQQDHRNVHPSMTGQHAQKEQRPGRPMQHPMAASMPQQAGAGQTGSGRGGFSWLLPFYTVGVVGFLLYTLFKIMFKSKKKQTKRRVHLGLDDSDEDEEESDEDGIYGARGQKLRSVQTRLRKTEYAMQEIMQQLEQIASQSQQFRQVPKEHRQEENTQSNERAATSAIPTNPTGNGDGERQQNLQNSSHQQQPAGQWDLNDLTDEQVIQMEKPLRELKMLSEMCKKDELLRRHLRENSSTEGSADVEEMIDDEEGEEEDDANEDRQNQANTFSQTDEESELEEEVDEQLLHSTNSSNTGARLKSE